MLFDLRGRGRRRTVKAIYLSLAILMGGGLVGFGIGSDQSGGIIDSLLGNEGDGSVDTDLEKEVKAALAKTKANPKDADAWATLTIARFKRAGIDGIAENGQYTEDGKRRLKLAADSYEQHLALTPKQPNVRAAKLMVNAYGTNGLSELKKAVAAKQIVTAAEDPPSSRDYALLAQLAYQAGEVRVADLAATRAVDLAEPNERKALRAAFKALKASGTQGIPEPTAAAGG